MKIRMENGEPPHFNSRHILQTGKSHKTNAKFAETEQILTWVESQPRGLLAWRADEVPPQVEHTPLSVQPRACLRATKSAPSNRMSARAACVKLKCTIDTLATIVCPSAIDAQESYHGRGQVPAGKRLTSPQSKRHDDPGWIAKCTQGTCEPVWRELSCKLAFYWFQRGNNKKRQGLSQVVVNVFPL